MRNCCAARARRSASSLALPAGWAGEVGGREGELKHRHRANADLSRLCLSSRHSPNTIDCACPNCYSPTNLNPTDAYPSAACPRASAARAARPFRASCEVETGSCVQVSSGQQCGKPCMHACMQRLRVSRANACLQSPDSLALHACPPAGAAVATLSCATVVPQPPPRPVPTERPAPAQQQRNASRATAEQQLNRLTCALPPPSCAPLPQPAAAPPPPPAGRQMEQQAQCDSPQQEVL